MALLVKRGFGGGGGRPMAENAPTSALVAWYWKDDEIVTSDTALSGSMNLVRLGNPKRATVNRATALTLH